MVNLKKLVVGLGLAGSVFAIAGGASARAILNEGFDGAVPPPGWSVVNNSAPIGTTSWFKGNPAIFAAQSGSADSYAAASFTAANPAGGNISDWLLTPVVALYNGDTFSFYTRTETGSPLPDRLQLRLSTNGASTNVGTTATSVGDFTTLLLDVNSSLAASGYPESWTQFTVTLSGLTAPLTGRYAFRYFVTDTTVNGNYIGIDSVLGISQIPEPSTLLAVTLGLALMGWQLRRRGIQDKMRTDRRAVA